MKICYAAIIAAGCWLLLNGSTPEIRHLATASQVDDIAVRALLSNNANAIVLDDHHTFIWQRSNRATYEVSKRIMVLNSDGRSHGQIVLMYNDFRSVRSVEAAIYTLSGNRVKRLRNRDFNDQSAGGSNLIDNYRIKEGEIYHDQYPYILEINYTIQFNSFVSFPSWSPISDRSALGTASYTIEVPASLPVFHHARNFGDIEMEPEINAVSGSRTRYTWSVNSIPARPRIPMAAPADRLAPTLYVKTDQFSYGGTNGSSATWQDFGDWIAELWHGRDSLPAEVQEDVRRLTEGLSSDREKIEAIYQFLQQNTRYVSIQLGIGGLQTEQASRTARDRYGDCKALTNYMMAMLKAAGIESFPALIRAGTDVPPVPDEFPSQSFNHVVLFIPMENDTLWVECTSNTAPLGYLGSMNANRTSLIIRGNGESELVRTPAYSANDNIQHRKGQLTLDERGNVDAQIRTTYGAIQNEYIRHVFTQQTPRNQQQYLVGSIDLSGLEILDSQVHVDPSQPLTELTFDVRVSRYGNRTGSRLHFQPNMLERGRFGARPDSNRTAPVHFRFAYSDADTLVYQLPEGLVVEVMPQNQIFETEYTRYEVNYTYDADSHTLVYIRRLDILEDSIPASLYNELLAFFSAVNRHDADRVILAER